MFILGGQRIDQKSKKGCREARRNEEREKRGLTKGSREMIIEKRERDKMREGGPERPPFYRILYILQGGPQASKFGFYKLIEFKKCHGVKQNAKICASGETECNET